MMMVRLSQFLDDVSSLMEPMGHRLLTLAFKKADDLYCFGGMSETVVISAADWLSAFPESKEPCREIRDGAFELMGLEAGFVGGESHRILYSVRMRGGVAKLYISIEFLQACVGLENMINDECFF